MRAWMRAKRTCGIYTTGTPEAPSSALGVSARALLALRGAHAPSADPRVPRRPPGLPDALANAALLAIVCVTAEARPPRPLPAPVSLPTLPFLPSSFSLSLHLLPFNFLRVLVTFWLRLNNITGGAYLSTAPRTAAESRAWYNSACLRRVLSTNERNSHMATVPPGRPRRQRGRRSA